MNFDHQPNFQDTMIKYVSFNMRLELIKNEARVMVKSFYRVHNEETNKKQLNPLFVCIVVINKTI